MGFCGGHECFDRVYRRLCKLTSSPTAPRAFCVDVVTSCKGVGFNAELAGPIANKKVERRKVLGPAGLSPGEHFGGGKVFEVLVIRYDVDWGWRSFEVMPP